VPLAVYCHLPATDAFPKARAAAVMALELDPRLAEARTVLAAYKAGHEWDLAGAEAEVRTALADNPQYSRAWQGLAEICTASRRLAEAEAAAKRALELDPLALSLNAFMSMTYFFSNRPDDAIEYGRRTVEMDPAFFPGHLCCGLALQAGGRLDEAADAMQRGYEASAGSTLMLAALGSAAAARGDRSRAAAILRELEDAGRRRYVSAVWVAAIHHALGDDESAIASLERGCRERCYWLIRAVTVDPRFDGLRRDPRLDDVRRRMGLAGAGGA
jgi:tetratricopeptide (TPR) repeat protein